MELLKELVLAYGSVCLSEYAAESRGDESPDDKELRKTLREIKLLVRNLVGNGVPHQMPVTERISFMSEMTKLCGEYYAAIRDAHIETVGMTSYLLDDKPTWQS